MPHNEFKPVLEAIEEESIEDEIEAAIKGKDHKFKSEVLSKAVKGAMEVGNFKKIGTVN